MNRLAAYCLAGLLVFATARSLGAAPDVIPLTLPSGKVLQVEVMVKDEDRAMGLMFRPSLAPDRGMLFLFEASDFHGIWMKNCKFPIDILWLDADRKIVHVQEGAPPCVKEPCPVYSPLRTRHLRRRARLGPGAPREGRGRRDGRLHPPALDLVGLPSRPAEDEGHQHPQKIQAQHGQGEQGLVDHVRGGGDDRGDDERTRAPRT